MLENLEAAAGGCPVLQEEVCRYLQIFNHAPVAIAVIDPQTNRYLEVNQVLCDRLKYSREELLRSSVPVINPRFKPAALSELARRLRTDNVVQFYSYQTTSKGDEREVVMTVTPIHRDGAMLLHCATVDITVPLRDERRLIDSEKRFRNTFEQAAVGIAHVAIDGTFLRVNQRYCEITGYSEPELGDARFQDITHPEDLAADWGRAQALLRGEINTYSLEKRYIRKDETQVWVNLTVSLARNEIAEPEYFIAVVQDIGARKKIEAERDELIHTLEEQVRRRTEDLERLSMTDALTGIANRRCFDKVMAAEWARAQRSQQPLSLLVVDVDHFKSLNDHRGHAYGDRSMVAIAYALRQLSVRSSDLVARYGGDEFIFLLPETDRAGAGRLARKVKSAIRALAISNPGAPRSGSLTVSQGTATLIPKPGRTAQDLLDEADRAMYTAKRCGRNRIVAGAPE